MEIKFSNHTTAMDEARRLRTSLAAHGIKVTTRVVRGYIVIEAARHGATQTQVESVIGTCHGTIID